MMMRFALIAGIALGAATTAQAATDIQTVESENGFTAWLAEEHSIPFVALELRFRGGASLDEEGKRGATNLMVGLLEEGSGDMDARGFAAAAESIAANFSYDVGDDAVAVSARFLTETRDEAVDLLRQSLVEPTFSETALERVRAQVLSSIRSDVTDPDTLAAESFAKAAFGDHPYGSPYIGSLESVAALTREDMQTALHNAIAQDRVYVSAAGDITPEELSQLMDDLLSDLPETGAPMPEDVDVQMQGGETVVPFDTPQSTVVFGHEGIARDDPDFFAAYVMNHILGGGGFEARLMQEVREKRGLTYGVYSYLVPKDHGPVYMGRVASANDRVGEAVQVIRDEWARMAEEGVTEEELERAKTYLTGAYPLRFDSNAAIAGILVGMQLDGLDPEYVLTRNDKVEALTVEDINRVAKRLLKPEALHFAIVGQPEGLQEVSAPGQ
ncbi:peptidase M16 [Allosediminivita pacifica]|uniref:Zinc protease n=2 Tax=Allosediminivita pacifica TaxID=1267769 RepID=A0A2T6BA17_9RHOB|nr:zinc protease [Allosediminivita pacifica]GGA94807.1 peptidase M16 [Allosediminivita pacifica]